MQAGVLGKAVGAVARASAVCCRFPPGALYAERFPPVRAGLALWPVGWFSAAISRLPREIWRDADTEDNVNYDSVQVGY
jgi:hypothetical protein